MDQEAEERLLAEGKDSESLSLFKSLIRESPLSEKWHAYHNEYINRYDHRADKLKNRFDVTPVYVPSRLYFFDCVSRMLSSRNGVGLKKKTGQEPIPECAIRIFKPHQSLQPSILTTCKQICAEQTVSDLFLQGFDLGDFDDATVFKMSKNTRSVVLDRCKFHADFVKGLLLQLMDCTELCKLHLGCKVLCKVEKELEEVLENLIQHHEAKEGGSTGESLPWLRLICDTSLTSQFQQKWRQRSKETNIKFMVTSRVVNTDVVTVRGYVHPHVKTVIVGISNVKIDPPL